MEGGSIDEVREEPPEDDLDNLLMVNVINFNWRRSEVQLVSFLLRKASSLRKMLIVSPNFTPPDLLPCVEADLLRSLSWTSCLRLVKSELYGLWVAISAHQGIILVDVTLIDNI